MYIKNPYARTLLRGDRIVLCNTKNGAFVRTSAKYYELLEECTKLEEQKIVAKDKKVEETLKYLFSELCKIDFYIPEKKFDKAFQMSMQIVYLSITDRCNLKCKHCIASAVDSRGEDPLDTEEWKNIIKQLVKAKPEEITFTGGEPLLRKDFIELLKFTKGCCGDTKLILSTNGILINDKNIKDITENVDTIAISLDGYDDESCAKVRGEGVYSKVIEAIKRIQANGYHKISLSMLESAYTEGHDAEFYTLCDELQVKPLFRRFSPTGRGEEHCDELMPNLENEEPLHADKLRCVLCHPGRKELDITAYGKVYPCAPLAGEKELCMGDLKENSLEEILNPQKAECLIEHLRPWKMEVCKDCDVNLFCHNCINYIIGIKQDTQRFKKFCNKTKAELEKIIWED